MGTSDFTKKEKTELLSIPERTFRAWAGEFIKEPPGKGYRRTYDGGEVVIFAVLKLLSQRGFSLRKIRPIIGYLKSKKNLLNPFHEWTLTRFSDLFLYIRGDCDQVNIGGKELGDPYPRGPIEEIVTLPEGKEEPPFPELAVETFINLLIIMRRVKYRA